MQCERCGRRFTVPDERAGQRGKCPCGAIIVVPLGRAEFPRPIPPSPGSRRTLHFAIGTALVALIVGIGMWRFALFKRFAGVGVEKLIPENTFMVATLDTQTLWSELAPMFRQPPLDKALPEFAESTGINIEKDIFSWAGAVTIFVRFGELLPSGAILVRISNKRAFATGWRKLLKVIEKGSDGKFKKKHYHGCLINTMPIESFRSSEEGIPIPMNIELAQVRGYAVVGLGVGAVEEIVDVSRGEKPSIVRQKTFAVMQKELPSQPTVFFAEDTSQVADAVALWSSSFPDSKAFPAEMLQEFSQLFGLAVVEERERVRLEMVALPIGEKAKRQFRSRFKLGPVRESTLTFVPETALGALLFHNLAGYFAATQETLKTMPQFPFEKMWKDCLKKAPFVFPDLDWASLARCLTGETGLFLLDVGEEKVQVLVATEGKDASSLNKQVQKLASWLQKNGLSLKSQQHQGVSFTSIYHPVFKREHVPLSPSFARIGNTLLITTDEESLKAAIDTSMGKKRSLREAPLYKKCRRQVADPTWSLTFLDLRFVNPVVERLARVERCKEVIPIYESLGLDKAKAIVGGETATDTRNRQTLIIEGGNALHLLVLPFGAPVALVAFPVFRSAHEKARTASCQSNLKQIGLAALMFEQDNGRLPDQQQFEKELDPYIRNRQVFRCSSATHAGSHYRMNRQVSGKRMASISSPADTILAFECDRQGKPEYRHNGGINLLFVDGHVKWLRRGMLSDGWWTPRAGD